MNNDDRKQLRCVCGHAENKHREWNVVTHSSKCFVKGCDCEIWRWNKKVRGR